MVVSSCLWGFLTLRESFAQGCVYMKYSKWKGLRRSLKLLYSVRKA